MDSSFDDPSDFTNLAFQGLDEHLRCPICKEFFKTAMILSTCSHTFCALCIRRALTAEQNCPSCRNPAFESQLHNNYVVDHLVGIWNSNRDQVLDLEKQKETLENSEIVEVGLSGSPMETCSSQNAANAPSSPPSRITRSSSRRSASQTSTETDAPKELAPEAELVDCSTCGRKIKLEDLDRHWDYCEQGKPDPKLEEETRTQTSQSPSGKRSLMFGDHQRSMSSSPIRKKKVNLGLKPSKIVYDMQTVPRLRKVMRELGLPDHGEKNVLVQRHKEYSVLYNSNVDSSDPVDVKVLLKQLMEKEKILSNSGQATTKVDETYIQEHKRKYAYEYDDMIKVTQERVRRKKLKEAEEKSKQSSEASASSMNKVTESNAVIGTANASRAEVEHLEGVVWDPLDDDDFMP